MNLSTAINIKLNLHINKVSNGSINLDNIPKLEEFCSNFLKLSYLISSNHLSFNFNNYSIIESYSRMACLCYHKSIISLQELSKLLDLHPDSCKRCCNCYLT